MTFRRDASLSIGAMFVHVIVSMPILVYSLLLETSTAEFSCSCKIVKTAEESVEAMSTRLRCAKCDADDVC